MQSMLLVKDQEIHSLKSTLERLETELAQVKSQKPKAPV
jgi:hypothetical protein